MKIVSWNVNGLRSCFRKGLAGFIAADQADVYGFQEVRTSAEDLESLPRPAGYRPFWFPGERKGYSGVLFYTKVKPRALITGIGDGEMDREGRVLAFEFDSFFLVNAYFPHTGRDLERLDFKLRFNEAFADFTKKLGRKKPLVMVGDFNVAHTEIDLANPRENEGNAGFTLSERAWFGGFLSSGYVDTFRALTPEKRHYAWWTWRANARARNIGWRIDYAVVTETLAESVTKSTILSNVMGSDHCPIRLEIANA